MPLGPASPVWNKLYEALSRLAASCGGAFAFVVDEGNGLWCVALANTPPTTRTNEQDRAADRFYRTEIAPHATTLRRGGRIDMAKVDGDDRYVAMSFAGIYVLVVWFAETFEPAMARARIRRALPEIEALTLTLPPSGGPGADEGSGKIRA